MIKAPVPHDEDQRLSELRNYHVLETPPEHTFDQITKLAASICGTNVALVSLVDENRQWFKSCFGLSASETPRDISFCGHAIMGDDIFIIPDASVDPRFSDNPLVTGELGVRFYAGCPLTTPTGNRIGTLCVIDTTARNLDESQKTTLKALASHVVDLFELRKKNLELEVLSAQYRDVQRMSKTGGWELDASTGQISWSDEIYEIYQVPRDSKPQLAECLKFYAPKDRERMSQLYRTSLVSGESFDSEFEFTDATGKAKWIRIIGKGQRFPDGRIQKLLGTFQDISDQKFSEAKHRTIFQQSVDPIMTLSPPSWKFTSANPATVRLFGASSSEEFCSLGPWQVSPEFQPDGQLSSEKAKTMIEKAMVTGSHFFEWTHMRLDGTLMECTVLLSKIENGNETYLQATVRDVSEQKKIEAQQKVLEAQLIEAQSIAKTGSWFLSLETGEQTWSEEHYKIFEIPFPQPKEKLFALYREKIHPDDIKELDSFLAQAMVDGKSFTFDHRAVFPDGRIKYVQGISKVIQNADGKPIAVSGTCRDRTADVETELKNRLLLESMSEGMVVVNQQGIISYNSSALSILQLTPEQLFGKAKLPAGWQLIRENGERYPFREHPAILSLITGEIVPSVKMGIRLPNDDIRWISLNAVPVKDTEGKRVISTFSDITPLIKANQENRFILDTVGIGVWQANLLTGEQNWDSSMFQLYEIDPAEFTNNLQGWEKCLTEQAKKTIQDDWTSIAQGAQTISNTIEIVTPSGKTKFIGTRGKVIRNPEGKPVTLYGVNWDRTKEVELERNLENERAKSLHNAKLASIGQLAAGVGHEINNPLAIVSGLISMTEQMVLEKYDTSVIQDKFRKMESSVVRIANIVKGLRTFARSDSNEISSFDPFDMIKETCDLLKDLYLRDEVILTLNINQVPASLKGNRGRLQQVLVNLISNAKDATEGRPGRAVELSAFVDAGNLHLAITDNGTGIDPSIREKIFEPFFTTKEVNKGTGIGLSLVNTIVKEHGGKMDFFTELGVGTEFRVLIPVTIEAVKPVAVNSSNGPVPVVRGRVLIVDDENDLREVMREILLMNFSEVYTASSVTDALRILNEKVMDVIVSDIKMPIIDGFSFLRMIRQNERLAKIPVIFITGGIEMSSAEENIVSRDANGFFVKPVKIPELVMKVKQLLSGP